jgi:hypothetical protein
MFAALSAGAFFNVGACAAEPVPVDVSTWSVAAVFPASNPIAELVEYGRDPTAAVKLEFVPPFAKGKMPATPVASCSDPLATWLKLVTCEHPELMSPEQEEPLGTAPPSCSSPDVPSHTARWPLTTGLANQLALQADPSAQVAPFTAVAGLTSAVLGIPVSRAPDTAGN